MGLDLLDVAFRIERAFKINVSMDDFARCPRTTTAWSTHSASMRLALVLIAGWFAILERADSVRANLLCVPVERK